MKKIREIYDYREMIFSLVKRDLRGRYKGSVLGFFWTFLNPLLQLLVYTFVFSAVMRNNIEQYYLFLFVGLVPWIFFNTSIVNGATCILNQGDMVNKIYFPREVLPLTTVISAFVNMLLSFVVVFLVLLLSGFGLNFIAILFLPIIMLVEFIMALGIAMVFAALTVFLRDLAYVLNIIAMAWQFLSPVMYSAEMVPEQYRTIFYLNPMTPVIEAYRTILYYKQIPDLRTLVTASVFGIAVLVVGMAIFSKLQKKFAEEI